MHAPDARETNERELLSLTLPLWLVYCALGALLVYGAFALFGCASSPVHDAADAARFDAIAPAHFRYVVADPALTARERAARLDTLKLWRADLELRQQHPAALPETQAPKPHDPGTPDVIQPGTAQPSESGAVPR